MEALTAMPEGSSIRVDSTAHGHWTFTRVADGWSREGAVVKDGFFSGYVAEGKVSDAATLMPRLGDWYESNRYWSWVIENPVEDRVQVLRFPRVTSWRAPMPENVLVRNLNGPRARSHRLSEAPAGVLVAENMLWLLTSWQQAQAQVDRLSSEQETLVEQRNTYKNRPDPAQMMPALHDAEEALIRLRALVSTGSA
jgi:hypothetical protein